MFSTNQKGGRISEDQTNLLELQDHLLGNHFEHNIEDSVTSAKLVDSVLAKEFNKLSTQERSKTYEELHGVNDCVDETPVFVQNSLRQLDEALTRITEKPGYEIAAQQNKAYVTNPKFRLMFLRADGFHPEKAATRLVGYFAGMQKYFGDNLLTKRIQFSDLDSDDQACVKGGHLQVLPSRDRSGRGAVIDVGVYCDQSYKTPTNRLKAVLYLFLMLADDEENQKRGLVMIAMQMGPIDLGRATHSLFREYSRLLSWIPIRICAPHVCSDNDFMGFIFRAAVVGTPADIRVRHRFHSGTFTEIMYSLLGYGIPVEIFPSTDGVVIKKRNWNQWIGKYIARDKELAKNGGVFSGVDLPTRNDVLWGKGRPTQHHPGNVHLRELVEECIDEYQAAHLSVDKMEIVHKVCSMIKARSGRFLQKDDEGWWRESRNVDAVAKVRKLFQGTKKKEKSHRDHLTHAPQDDGENDAFMFQRQGKRQRSDAGCCGL
jgi:hypothetical protein